MRNWSKWRKGSKLRSQRARKAARAKWQQYHEEMAEEPIRENLPVIQIRLTIEQPHTTMRVLELRRKNDRPATYMFEDGQFCGRGGKCRLFRIAERQTVV